MGIIEHLEIPEFLIRIRHIELHSGMTADLWSAMHRCTPP